MSINQKSVDQAKKEGYVINNGKVLCAQSAIADRYSNLNKIFYKQAWTLVTEAEAMRLKDCKEEGTGKAWLKFAYIPLEKVPQFNSTLPNPEERVEEVQISKKLFAKKAPEAAPAAPVIPTVDLDDDGIGEESDEDAESDGEESEDTEESFDEAFAPKTDSAPKGDGPGADTVLGKEIEKSNENPATSVERKELQKKTVKELQAICKGELGLSLKGSEKKDELIEMILG